MRVYTVNTLSFCTVCMYMEECKHFIFLFFPGARGWYDDYNRRTFWGTTSEWICWHESMAPFCIQHFNLKQITEILNFKNFVSILLHFLSDYAQKASLRKPAHSGREQDLARYSVYLLYWHKSTNTIAARIKSMYIPFPVCMCLICLFNPSGLNRTAQIISWSRKLNPIKKWCRET